MSHSAPYVILVPDAWHTSKVYSPTTSLLEMAGYDCETVELPSLNANPPLTSWAADVDRVREVIRNAVNQQRDVVLVMHSCGALAGSVACKRLTKAYRRRKGMDGGVVHLVYVAGLIVPEGSTLLSFLADRMPVWVEYKDHGMTAKAKYESLIFYNDIPPAMSRHLVAALGLSPTCLFFAEVGYAAWRDVPSTYVVCKKDNAVPLSVQIHAIENMNVKCDIQVCASGHMPFVSQPAFVAAVIVKAVEGGPGE